MAAAFVAFYAPRAGVIAVVLRDSAGHGNGSGMGATPMLPKFARQVGTIGLGDSRKIAPSPIR